MNTNKYKFLRWVMYASLCIIPFLAFYVSGFGIGASWNNMLFPYITGKNFGFRILVEIAAAAWVMLMILDKSFRPKKSILLWIYTAFIGILLLADIFSVNPLRSFLSNFERMEGFITHGHLFLYFLMLVTLFKTKVDWGRYKFILFLSNIPVLVLAFLQLLGLSTFAPMKYLPALRDALHSKFAPTQGGSQLDSTLGNSTYLAIYAVFFIFLFFISWLESRKGKVKNSWVYLLMTVLNLIVLFYTQTRGAQVGFAVGVFVAALIIFFGGKKYHDLKNKRKVSLAIIAVVLLCYIGLVAFGKSTLIQNSSTLNKLAKISNFANPVTLPAKISEIETKLYDKNGTYTDLLAVSGDSTFTSRMLNIKMALDGFKQRPILGWGQDNYFYVFAKYNDARMYAQEPWFDRTHNVFMDWLIAGGILGLITYLGLYFGAFWVMWFSKDAKSHRGKSSTEFVEKALITGLIIAYFIHNFFVFDNLISYILFVIILAYIGTAFNHKEQKLVLAKHEDSKSKMIIYGPVVLIALLCSLYFLNIKYINANRYIIKGLAPEIKSGENPVDALSRSLDAFKRAAEIGGIAELESREQLAQNTLNLINQVKSSNIPQSAEYAPIFKLVSDSINLTKSSYKDIVDKNPDPRSLTIYSAFLRNIGDIEDALKYSKLAYQAAPNKQTVAMEYLQSLLDAKEYNEASIVAKSIYDADPTYKEAKPALALSYAYAGKFSEAESLLKREDGSIQINENIMDAYNASGQDARLINILKKNLEIAPTDITSAVILASVYMQNGAKVSAINVLRNLEKSMPELKDQIENYIKNNL